MPKRNGSQLYLMVAIGNIFVDELSKYVGYFQQYPPGDDVSSCYVIASNINGIADRAKESSVFSDDR